MTSLPKIALTAATSIPFSKLVLSQRNVRRIHQGQSIESLADDIQHRGLLQSLHVRPELDAAGEATGRYEVPAGGRRFRALELLVKTKRLAKNAPVPCIVREAGSPISAEEDSLAENVHREALHPLDQFRAFKDLIQLGLGEADVAARFLVSPAVVRQRLKLTTVSPKLLEGYAAGEMRLDQLEAFSVSDDHARQETLWAVPSNGYNKEPHNIRRALTEDAVDASRDKRALFVDVTAYEAAGGRVMRDLFTPDHGGYLVDVALLNTLAEEKMKALVGELYAEGWLWVEASVAGFAWDHTRAMRQIEPAEAEMGDEEQARYDALREQYDRLQLEHEGADELPDAVDARLGELEQAIEVMQETCALRFSSEQKAYAGALIDLEYGGEVRIRRGLVRAQDEPKVDEPALKGDDTAGQTRRVVVTAGGADSLDEADPSVGTDPAGVAVPTPEPEDDDPEKPITAALMTELTTQRTAALREALAADPGAAFVAVLYTLVLQAFYGSGSHVSGQGWRSRTAESCLEVSFRFASLAKEVPGLAQAPSVTALAERSRAWGERLPHEAAKLWAYLVGLDSDSRADLFALCAGLTVNAISAPQPTSYGMDRARPIVHADQLAELVGLDMSQHWIPTAENYLGRITKGRILGAVREAKGEATASLIEHLKRPEMAREAERLLAGTGWLPQPLRTRSLNRGELRALAVPSPAEGVQTSARTEDGEALPGLQPLPAFLASEDEADGEELTRDSEDVEPLPAWFHDGPLPTDLDGFAPDYPAIAAE